MDVVVYKLIFPDLARPGKIIKPPSYTSTLDFLVYKSMLPLTTVLY